MVCADTDHQATKSHSKWWWAAAKLDGDISFHCTTRDGARLLSAAGNPAYLYSFEPAGFPSEVIGHCSEKSFLLDSVWPAMPAPLIELGEAMGRSWVAFVSRPRPHRCATRVVLCRHDPVRPHLTANERRCWKANTGAPHPEGEATWPRYSEATDQHMVWAAPGGHASSGLRKASCDFWDRQGYPTPV